MNTWKAILLGFCIVLIGAALDLYLVTLANRWAVHKVGEIGNLSGAFLLLLPELVFGFFVGLVTALVARRVAAGYFRTAVLLGFAGYFIWKFQVTQVWIAPDVIAYALALGPYAIFFIAFGAAAFLMRRKNGHVGMGEMRIPS